MQTLATDAVAAASSLECPSEMAPIVDLEVCIDRGEFPGTGQMPRTHVSLAEAEQACTDRGLRLCAADEWRRACRGRDDVMHPYGTASDPARCNGCGMCVALAHDLKAHGPHRKAFAKREIENWGQTDRDFVHHCPTGAITTERADPGQQAMPPAEGEEPNTAGR